MSKNQGGIVQYVDFHQEVAVKIISEKKSTKLKKPSASVILNKVDSIESAPKKEQKAAVVQLIQPKVEEKLKVQPVKKSVTKSVKPVKIVKKAKSVTKISVKSAVKTVAKAEVKAEVKAEEKIVEVPVKSNVIHAFFEKNKAFYDIKSILLNEIESKIVIFKDDTNEKIHKKAMTAIIKALKSKRKFKLEVASLAS